MNIEEFDSTHPPCFQFCNQSCRNILSQYDLPASVTFISLCPCSNSHPRHHQHHCLKAALEFFPGPSFDPFQARDLGLGIGGGWFNHWLMGQGWWQNLNLHILCTYLAQMPRGISRWCFLNIPLFDLTYARTISRGWFSICGSTTRGKLESPSLYLLTALEFGHTIRLWGRHSIRFKYLLSINLAESLKTSFFDLFFFVKTLQIQHIFVVLLSL